MPIEILCMELKYHKIAIILGLAYSRDPLLTNTSVFVKFKIFSVILRDLYSRGKKDTDPSIGVTYLSKEKQRLATHWVTATQKQ